MKFNGFKIKEFLSKKSNKGYSITGLFSILFVIVFLSESSPDPVRDNPTVAPNSNLQTLLIQLDSVVNAKGDVSAFVKTHEASFVRRVKTNFRQHIDSLAWGYMPKGTALSLLNDKRELIEEDASQNELFAIIYQKGEIADIRCIWCWNGGTSSIKEFIPLYRVVKPFTIRKGECLFDYEDEGGVRFWVNSFPSLKWKVRKLGARRYLRSPRQNFNFYIARTGLYKVKVFVYKGTTFDRANQRIILPSGKILYAK